MPWFKNRDGQSLWYEEQGRGTALVFLHGWGISSAVWRYQLTGLADSFRVIAPDLRGHGRSKISTVHYDFPAFADDLSDLITALDLHNLLLVGWSMGAEVALQACRQISGRLSGLLLVSATPCFIAHAGFQSGLTATEAAGMRLKVRRNSGRALDGFYGRLFEEGELDTYCQKEISELLSAIEYPDTPALLDALDALTRADMRPLLADITVPILILNGDRDRICLPQASRYLAATMPNARQHEFSGCGHAPFLSRPEQFNAEIRRFAGRCSHEQG